MSLNTIRPWRNIYRRKSRKIYVGNVPVGGDSPISVQTMTNTLTHDINATVSQINACADAGADMVRVSCPDIASTKAMHEIVKESKVPLIADIHFHYKRAIEAAEAGAACLRINPGNIGSKERIKEVIKAAKDYGCSIRIGVNGGSLEKQLLDKYGEPCPDAMIESGMNHIRILEDNDFQNYKISVKASDVFMSAAAYQGLAEATDAPIHLGITEAGGLTSGTIKSAIGLGNLLWMGIGDTIRVSLSADPVEEVKVGFEILKSLGLRHRGVNIISCPSCARQGFNVIETVSREGMWVAQTPQMFKFNILYESIKHCIDNDIPVTDESQALEILGHACRVHIGRNYNIKITRNSDMWQAKCISNHLLEYIDEEDFEDK